MCDFDHAIVDIVFTRRSVLRWLGHPDDAWSLANDRRFFLVLESWQHNGFLRNLSRVVDLRLVNQDGIAVESGSAK